MSAVLLAILALWVVNMVLGGLLVGDPIGAGTVVTVLILMVGGVGLLVAHAAAQIVGAA